jgi:hypothetical protein
LLEILVVSFAPRLTRPGTHHGLLATDLKRFPDLLKVIPAFARISLAAFPSLAAGIHDGSLGIRDILGIRYDIRSLAWAFVH